MFGGSPQSQGLLAAAAQIAQASGPSRTPRGLYQILGSGALAGQDATQKAQDREVETQLANIRMQDLQSETAARMRKQQEADRLIKFYSGAASAAAPGMAMPTSEGVAPQSPQSPPIGSMGRPVGAQTSAAPNATAVWFDQQMSKVDQLRAAGLVDEATRVEKQALAFRGKATWKDVKRDGKVLNMPFYEDGTAGEAAGAEVAQNLNWQDTGQETIGLNPTFGTVEARLKNTVAPNTAATVAASREASAASNAVARGNLEVSRQRLGLEREKLARETQGGAGQKPPQGYRWAPDGSLEAIPGGPATKHATATEGERKAETLRQRLQFSENQLEEALKTDPGAATPTLTAQALRRFGPEALANSATKESRQKVEAAQLDILDAALTLGTGAAYTKEQLEGYRKSYFPQIGDEEGTVKDKKARLANVIKAAKVAAGRAAPAEPAAPKSDFSNIPPRAAAHLKMKPGLRGEFDAKFGAGAAAYVLGK